MMRLFVALLLCVVPCTAPPRKAMSSGGGSDDEGMDEGRSQGDNNSVILAGLVVMLVGAAKTCKLCGTLSNEPNPYGTRDPDMKHWPWQSYWPVYDSAGENVIGKRASGKICALCPSVMKQSGLMKEHGSIAKYVKWKNGGDALERHSGFMHDLRAFVAKIKKKPEIMRIHIRHRSNDISCCFMSMIVCL